MLPWLLCGALAAAVIALLLKIMLLKKAMDEIRSELGERLSQDTNTLISISSRDRHARLLAVALNEQLRLLRKERRRFQSGNRELKDAVANISHDLRTPLTAVFGYLELMEKEEKSEAAARYLSLIENRARALKQLTEELFQYSVFTSAPENIRLEEVAVNSALEESIAAHYAALKERGITPRIRMPEKAVLRRLDRAALSRVFSNLMSNALKYSDGDLEITLSEACEITFSNAASGLTEVQVGKLFDRFYTVEAARKSTGLGLAIARTMVERMRGTIVAHYRAGRISLCVCFPEVGETEQ